MTEREGLQEGVRARGIQDVRDARQQGYETGGKHKTERKNDSMDAGQEVYRRVEKLDMMGTGQEGRRTGGIKDRCLKKQIKVNFSKTT